MQNVEYDVGLSVDAGCWSACDDGMRHRVGTRLRAVRVMMGLSAKEVADSVGCSPSHLSRIENAKLLPSVPMLLRLCNELGVDMARIMDHQGDVLPTIHRTGISPKASRFELAGQGQVHWLGQHRAGSLEVKSHYFKVGTPVVDIANLQGEAIIVITSGVLTIRCGSASVDARSGDGFHLAISGIHTFTNGSDADLTVVVISRLQA